MKNYFCKNLFKSIPLIIFLIPFNFLKDYSLNAEYLVEETLIDSSTKVDDDISGIPTNPFEIVEMLRKYNSMNRATNPSDALDDAIKSFNVMEEK